MGYRGGIDGAYWGMIGGYTEELGLSAGSSAFTKNLVG
jgi:hypothetical protein